MGYTHYWHGAKSAIGKRAWAAAVTDCRSIIAAGTPIFRLTTNTEDGFISINGDQDLYESHETFIIKPPVELVRMCRMNCCQTARKPYDTVVTACLARLGEAGLAISSDGRADEWAPGLAFGELVLGRPLALKLGKNI